MIPTDDKVKDIRNILRNLMDRVPPKIKLDKDDIGFLIVSAICNANGARFIGEEFYHDDILIGKSVKFKFDGDILHIVYLSTLTEKVITKTLRIVV